MGFEHDGLGLCPKPRQRNFLEKVSLESSKTFNGAKLRFPQGYFRLLFAEIGDFGHSKFWGIQNPFFKKGFGRGAGATPPRAPQSQNSATQRS